MSTQVPQPATLPPEWTPKRREQGGFNQVRRDEHGKQTFKGQDPDEEIKMVVRQHPLFLLRPGLPALAALILLSITLALMLRFPAFGAVWGLMSLILTLLFIIALGYFIWRDFINWWVNIDIITNKRVIVCRGFILPTRKVTTLDKIIQISVDQDSLLSTFLNYGNVHLYLIGGDYIMNNVPKPQEVRDAVHGVFTEFKAKSKKSEKLPTLADPAMTALIAQLGKKEKVPELPNADRIHTQGEMPEVVRHPMRRFGGPLRIPANVTYTPDEHTVMYIQRSKWLLAIRLILPALGMLAALVLTFLLPPPLSLLTALAALVLLVIMALLTINYVDDVFILTNKRVIDIERKYIFFFEERIEADYKNIRDIKTDVKNILQTLLDVGNVHVETPGSNPDINLTLVDHPFFIADKINQLKGFKEKVDKAKDRNTRQDELVKWFTNVAAVLEKKIVGRGVPNLQDMDYWSAVSLAAEAGMKVVPVGEDDAHPHIAPGHIVSQDPLPGTLMEINPNLPDGRPEIQVVLSKRP